MVVRGRETANTARGHTRDGSCHSSTSDFHLRAKLSRDNCIQIPTPLSRRRVYTIVHVAIRADTRSRRISRVLCHTKILAARNTIKHAIKHHDTQGIQYDTQWTLPTTYANRSTQHPSHSTNHISTRLKTQKNGRKQMHKISYGINIGQRHMHRYQTHTYAPQNTPRRNTWNTWHNT